MVPFSFKPLNSIPWVLEDSCKLNFREVKISHSLYQSQYFSSSKSTSFLRLKAMSQALNVLTYALQLHYVKYNCHH